MRTYSMIESLESRRLFSATINVQDVSLLKVDGTGDDDQIQITISGGSLVVRLNGTDQAFDAAAISSIEIRAGTGDDSISVDPGVTQPCRIDGDDGDDLIIGGDGEDTLIGGSGRDTIAGNGGDDFIEGRADDDCLDGGAGNDTLIGGDGDDTLLGRGGNDSLSGLNGADDLHGGDDDDTLQGGPDRDTVKGDHGEDNLIADRGDLLVKDAADNGADQSGIMPMSAALTDDLDDDPSESSTDKQSADAAAAAISLASSDGTGADLDAPDPIATGIFNGPVKYPDKPYKEQDDLVDLLSD